MPDITYTAKGLPEVQRTLERYMEVCQSKTFREICNGKTLDMSYRSLAETRKASAQEIRNLPLRPWWPKYVAKVLASTGVKLSRARTKTEKFITGSKGRIKFVVQGRFTKEQARAASRRLIAARLSSIAFIASGWIAAIRDLKKFTRDSNGSTAGVRQRGQAKGYGRGANSGFGNVEAVGGSTSLNPKQSADAARALVVGLDGAERGVRASIADMNTYIDRKMREGAREAGVPLR